MNILDYIIVGSGCSGAMAAQTLVERGAKVTMLDVGSEKPASIPTIPDKDFLDIRTTDPQQYKYLIGENAEGVQWGKVGKGEQLTPPRQHITKHVEEYIPVESSSFSSLESLSYGGLGTGWGLQCWQYSKYDMREVGLSAVAMKSAYQLVSNRIGISATADDTARYTIGTLKDYQHSPTMDRNHTYIYEKYLSGRERFNRQGFYMGRTPLALLTENKDNRKGYTYHGMDFYSDNDLSAWRPWITINTLKVKSNFRYESNLLITSFVEYDKYTQVNCIHINDNKSVKFYCRRLILATSALGSARIVLRSVGQAKTRLPILCNTWSYIPCVQPRFVGKDAEPKKLGFTQLSLFLDPDRNNINTSVASLYSYQSLMLFRIIRHVPLDFQDAQILMRYLMSGIIILAIQHSDRTTSEKYLRLRSEPHNPTGSVLNIEYALTSDEARDHISRERAFMRVMRRMGTFGLKRMDPGFGSSIHYAGTLPFSKSNEPFTLASSGRLHGTKSVYVADSSGFRYLPAPGLTFSLMANAHLVAENAFHGK